LYLVGSFVLVSLAGCGRGFFQSAEREPWRAEAEIACLKSGAVRETPELVRIDPISGPGVCGAAYPLKVVALGEASGAFSFGDESRPRADVGNQPRWPVAVPAYAAPPLRQPNDGAHVGAPISLSPPGIAPAQQDDIDQPSGGGNADPRRDRYPPYTARPTATPSWPPPGPAQGNSATTLGPVAIKPAATLACPIVSVLDRWLADSVQPSAQRWFGARVVEIRQISAYSCRGMNGNSHAHISEHAFGNALDIAAFTLADGRHVTVKDGWSGMPEEQGFLRDVQATACQQFNTVLAPGSNAYHDDHIHVDLMRRASRRVICQPAAASGAEIAASAGARNPRASRETFVTGSLGGHKPLPHQRKAGSRVNEEDEFADD